MKSVRVRSHFVDYADDLEFYLRFPCSLSLNQIKELDYFNSIVFIKRCSGQFRVDLSLTDGKQLPKTRTDSRQLIKSSK